MTTDRPTLEADLARARQNSDFAAEAACLIALAQIANEEKEYALSQALYAQARDAYDHAQDKNGKAEALKALAQALINGELGEQRTACTYLAEAIPLYEQLGDQHEQARLYTVLAHCYWQINENEIRIPLYEKALALLERIKDPVVQAKFSLELGGSMYGLPEFQPFYERAMLLHEKADYRIRVDPDGKV